MPLALLLLALSTAAVVGYRAQSTINDVQSVSALPPRVTDATEGDDGVPSGLTFDTAPARQALQEAGIAPADEGRGAFGRFKDAAGDVGELADGAAVAAGVREPSSGATVILIMGVDARPGAPIDIGVRPDALMVLFLDPGSGACRGLAIPRDTLTELPGYGRTKINHALMVGGIAYQRLVVERFLGLPIEHYALVDFVGFKELVDAVGGVPVTVPSDIAEGERTLFAAGPQTFNGDDALRYARYRGGADVDVGRVRRQQQIIRGLVQVGSGRDLAGDANDILPALSAHVRTDLKTADLVGLGEQYRARCSESTLHLESLAGSVYSPGTPDPLYQQPLDYVAVDQTVIDEKVAALTRP